MKPNFLQHLNVSFLQVIKTYLEVNKSQHKQHHVYSI